MTAQLPALLSVVIHGKDNGNDSALKNGFWASRCLTLTVPSSLAVHIHFECFSKPTAAATNITL